MVRGAMDSPRLALPPKSPFLSKTVIGILLMLLGWVNDKWKLGMGGAENAQTVQDFLTIGGLVLGIWGRYAARRPLALMPNDAPRMWLLCAFLDAGIWMMKATCMILLAVICTQQIHRKFQGGREVAMASQPVTALPSHDPSEPQELADDHLFERAIRPGGNSEAVTEIASRSSARSSLFFPLSK